MTGNDWVQLLLFVGVLVALTKPLGWFMARVYQGQPCGLDRVVGPLERGLYRVARVDATREMGWREYAGCVLAFNFLGFFALYALLRLQGMLPLNPQGFAGNTPDLAFDTAAS